MRARGINLVVLCGIMLAPVALRADGGVVCLHEISGPFLVTVFTTPAVLRAGPADVSVMVQDSPTREVLLNAVVDFNLDPEAGGSSISARATREQSTNKLLRSALINIPSAGRWKLTVSVRRGSEQARFRTLLQVAPPLPRLASIWPFLLPPPLAVLLFVANQVLRRSRTKPLPA